MTAAPTTANTPAAAPAVFVTATGTDIGKTFVTAGLVRTLRSRGLPATALKPVVSGLDPDTPAGSDPAVLLDAMGQPVTAETIAAISPFRFRAPLSPDMAAAREGRRLDVPALMDFCRHEIARAEAPLFIEGVGGIMVPLDDRLTVLDWMAELALPLVVVTGSYLGTLSHTLTALDVLARRGLAVRCLAVSETAGSTVPLDATLETLARFAGAIPVVPVPRNPSADAFGTVLDAITR